MKFLNPDHKLLSLALTLLLAVACGGSEPKPGPGPEPEPDPEYPADYVYPFSTDGGNVVAEITLELNEGTSANGLSASVPPLKYNKSWLFMLTQDDCMQVAYCCTWAAIHGKPLSPAYYYNAAQLAAGDLPPDVYSLGKTLGSTDGAGNEVRFSFATTLSAESSWMNDRSIVDKGHTADYYRFYMRDGLYWENVREMCNYGVGIGFHDVAAEDVDNASSILNHYGIAQNLIISKLSGRGCKFLAEPNGNKTYLSAAQSYAPIKTTTAQGDGGGFTAESIVPFAGGDITGKLVLREFYDSPEDVKTKIAEQLALPREQRRAIALGVHGTDGPWAQFLLWLNNTHGKDGDDSVWAASQEEYYEYSYYRTHATVTAEAQEGGKVKVTVTLPAGQYFYYPSLTVNLAGLSKAGIKSVASNDAVGGLSWADCSEGLMLNIDCRKSLDYHATYYVKRYEADRSNLSNKRDALYFIGMMKESARKETLLGRVN